MRIARAGKRGAGRDKPEQDSAPYSADNRIFLDITVDAFRTRALLGTGAVPLCISPQMASRCEQAGWTRQEEDLTVALANGEEAIVHTSMTGRMKVNRTTLSHTFLVIDGLRHEMVLGTDLLNKSGLRVYMGTQRLRPGCLIPNRGLRSVEAPSGLTFTEESELKAFPRQELAVFDNVTGITPLIGHKIHLTDPTPIKQRYRSRNPAIQATTKKCRRC